MTTTTEKYRAIAKLGAGGMASVELAVMNGSAGINKLVVVKKLLAHLAKDPSYVAMFVNEARVAARLSHPHVVSTYEVGSDGEVPFIVMEYLEGQALSALFRRMGRPHVTLPFQLHVLRGILAGLEYAHTLVDFDGRPLGLVHRDVSPQNAFVCYDGRVKLVDFGIAKVNGLEGEAKPGVLKGKIAYMAPEQLRGEDVDCRADVYSVGIMLWEALAARRMTLGEAEAAVVGKRKRGEVPDLAPFNPLAPPALVEVCQKALALAQSDRFSSAAAMMTALDAAAAATGNVAVERELGVFVAEAFASERARIQSVIETQLKSFTIAQAIPSALPEVERMDNSLVISLGGEEARSSAAPSSGPVSLSPGSGLIGEVSAPPVASIAELPSPPPRQKRLVWGAAFAAVAILVSGGWLAARQGSVVSASSAATEQPAGLRASSLGPSSPPSGRLAAPGRGASATAAAHVTLVLRATPEQASFVLDGKGLPGNPTTIQVLKDSRQHRLQVRSGRANAERTLSFDRDQTIEIGLASPDSSPLGVRKSEPSRGVREAETGSLPRPTARNRAHRTLDEQNPY